MQPLLLPQTPGAFSAQTQQLPEEPGPSSAGGRGRGSQTSAQTIPPARQSVRPSSLSPLQPVFSFPGVTAHPLSVHALSNPLSEPALSGQGLISARLISACQLPVCLVQKLQPVVKLKCRTCSCWLKSSPEPPEQHHGAQDQADQGSPRPNPQPQRPRSLAHQAPAPRAAHLPISSWGQRTRRSGASACPGKEAGTKLPRPTGPGGSPVPIVWPLLCSRAAQIPNCANNGDGGSRMERALFRGSPSLPSSCCAQGTPALTP